MRGGLHGPPTREWVRAAYTRKRVRAANARELSHAVHTHKEMREVHTREWVLATNTSEWVREVHTSKGLIDVLTREWVHATKTPKGVRKVIGHGGLLAAILCIGLCAWGSAPATALNRGGTAAPSVLVAFLAPGPPPAGQSEDDAIEAELSSIPTLSTGILSATQGTYKTVQLLLDISQGARVSYSAYTPANPPALSLFPLRSSGGGGHNPLKRSSAAQAQPWKAVLTRAKGAPQLLEPGLLAASIPGGAAYADAQVPLGTETAGTRAGTRPKHIPPGENIDGPLAADRSRRGENIDGPLAADRSGTLAAYSFGQRNTLLGRIARLGATHRLVITDLPSGAPGNTDLRILAATRPTNELLVVLQRAPDAPGHELLWSAFAGLPPLPGASGPGGHTLTSQTTNQRGLIASIDIAPTILTRLGLPVPANMRGKAVRLDGRFDGAEMRRLKARLEVITGRRLPAIAWLVAAWALLLAMTSLPIGWNARRAISGRRTRHQGTSTTAGQAQRGWVLRVGGLAMMWTPVAILLPAAIEPSRTVEFAMIVASCFALGALTDRLVHWPRAPIVPAVAAVLALTVDALAGTQLLVRSLLGPDPILGARFYGIGNELKSGLAVLVLSAVAAALYPAERGRERGRGRGAAAAMAGAGIVLAIVEGSARIGAGVGGVILVSAGTAVATVMLLPGALDRKRVLTVMAAPIIGLIVLALIDLATAHGGGHFTGSVLDARSAGDIRDVIVRRYGAAWDELKNHLMPVATALALVASVVAVRRRERLLTPVASDPAWLAALAGGLTAGAVGALTEDSGPVLLVVAVFVLGCVLSYLWGKPESTQPTTQAASRKGFSMQTEPIV